MKKILALLALCTAGAVYAEEATPPTPPTPPPAAPGDAAKPGFDRKALQEWLAKEETIKKFDKDGNGKLENTEMREARQAYMKEKGITPPPRGDKQRPQRPNAPKGGPAKQ